MENPAKLLRQNTADIKAALQDAHTYRDRRTFSRVLQLAVTGEVARLVARLLVCCFFLNLVRLNRQQWCNASVSCVQGCLTCMVAGLIPLHACRQPFVSLTAVGCMQLPPTSSNLRAVHLYSSNDGLTQV